MSPSDLKLTNLSPMKYFYYLFLFSGSLLFSCEKDEPFVHEFGTGVYITNEGFFMQNNGSVSFFRPGDGNLVNNIFEKANSRPAGDIVQSLGIIGDSLAYMIVNGSSKVEIVRLPDFKAVADPLEIDYPRYFISVSDVKGYISSGSMKGNLIVVDLERHAIIDSIPVGFGPEIMVKKDDMVFVCNSGGFYKDSTISVISVSTGIVTDTIKTAMCPADMEIDAEGYLWVYCRGYVQYDETYTTIISETDAVIQKIDPLSGTILWQGKVGKAGDYTTVFPRLSATADGNDIYYLRPDGAYYLSSASPKINAGPSIGGNYYGIFIHPADDDIYLFEANLSGNGMMHIFSNNLDKISEYMVGIMPNGAVYVP